MSELRVAKGWTLVGTSSVDTLSTKDKNEMRKRERTSDRLLRNASKMSLEAIQKSADDAYFERLERKKSLEEKKNKNK
jgi:hypothetical protein